MRRLGRVSQESAADLLRPVVGGRQRIICCHCGSLSGGWPPNSLEAVRECVAARVPRLEIDVRFLADDTMLVYHDATLDHETTGSGRVEELDGDRAGALRFSANEHLAIPFLADVVDALRGSGTLLQVDLKLMRVMSREREGRLAAALTPVKEHTLIGSQAHWNLRGLARRGFRVALDPALHWHYAPGRSPALFPGREGIHGLWDDAPIAHNRRVSALDYFAVRLDDLVTLLPEAVEWMVDIPTVRHMARHGFMLGHELAARGLELAAWTLRDRGAVETTAVLREMFAAGADCVIADDAPAVGACAATLGSGV